MSDMFKFIETPLPGAFIVEPRPFQDRRGLFARLFCREDFRAMGHEKEIVQVNHSVTTAKGAVRGMHFQWPPWTETKIIKCIRGAVFDVMVDIRKGSPTFLKWHGEVLSAENMRSAYIPDGFAHGFQTLEADCELLYFHTAVFSPSFEGAVRFDEPKVGVQWPLDVTDLSDRDGSHPYLADDFDGLPVE